MSTGSCLCGASRITVSGEPRAVMTCHCRDCRKITGSTFSTNWVVPRSSVTISSGSLGLSVSTVKAASGNTMTGYFCPGCGTTLYRSSEAAPDVCFVKAGVMDGDDAIVSRPPRHEGFTASRVSWVSQIEGAKQADGMCVL